LHTTPERGDGECRGDAEGKEKAVVCVCGGWGGVGWGIGDLEVYKTSLPYDQDYPFTMSVVYGNENKKITFTLPPSKD
jgi:hypothetical protein